MFVMIAGCGSSGSGGSGSDSPPSNPYGTLSISGSGKAITGDQYSPNFITYFPTSYGASYAWTYNDSRSTDYKSVSISAYGTSTNVEFDVSISGITYSWTTTSGTGVTIGSSSIIFNNVTLAGSVNTTTSLILNGTLIFM